MMQDYPKIPWLIFIMLFCVLANSLFYLGQINRSGLNYGDDAGYYVALSSVWAYRTSTLSILSPLTMLSQFNYQYVVMLGSALLFMGIVWLSSGDLRITFLSVAIPSVFLAHDKHGQLLLMLAFSIFILMEKLKKTRLEIATAVLAAASHRIGS